MLNRLILASHHLLTMALETKVEMVVGGEELLIVNMRMVILSLINAEVMIKVPQGESRPQIVVRVDGIYLRSIPIV